VPGSYTVGDAAERYGALPLYDASIDGSGSTVGIATLANFDPNDAFTYWDLVGLATDPARIEQVHVDGGGLLDDPNDPAGPYASLETVLDVQQAGGVAPGADIVVYDAPNTEAGFLDVFYRAASDNLVDSLSVSWGMPEVAEFEELGGGGSTLLVAMHQALLEAAAQGISVFAASGDSGAYDFNTSSNTPVHNVLAVDTPASDPMVTAAGGTTAPYTAGVEGAPDFVVATEQVWGWRSLEAYLVAYVDPGLEGQLFPIGGGGGVSVYWPRPSYQGGTFGIRASEAGQSIVFDDPEAGPVDLLDMPAAFAGRNVPDVSLNADPQTGYLLYWGSGGGLIAGIGGTSIVSPQLNGMSALVSEALGGRIGAWNPMLYRFKRTYRAASNPPVIDVTAGDNWFYNGAPGYEPGAGLGVLNVASFAAAVRRETRGR
jgi:subtilase family serine protease